MYVSAAPPLSLSWLYSRPQYFVWWYEIKSISTPRIGLTASSTKPIITSEKSVIFSLLQKFRHVDGGRGMPE